MRKPLAAIALGLLASACATSTTTTTTIAPSGTMVIADAALYEKARGIHDRVFTLDTHVDIPGNWSTTPLNDADSGTAQVTFRKMKQGGLDGAFFAVFVGQGPRTPAGDSAAKVAAMQKFSGIHRSIDTLYRDKIELAYQPEDIPRILAKGKLVGAIGIENGYVIGKDLSLIRTYYDLGARYMTLAHTSNNDICDSSTDQRGPEHNGLSAFGRQVVAEMNRVGMMVDVSHVSKQCMLQATALSTSPVMGSHSSTAAIANHPRNFDDDMLRAIAKNGGVMQTVAFASYVKVFPAERDSAIARLRAEFYPPDSIPAWRARADSAAGRAGAAVGGGRGAVGGGRGGAGGGRGGGRGALPPHPTRQADFDRRMAEITARYPPASIRDFADHIDHAVKVAGIDHVGISSDFDGGGGIVGWNSATETLNVTMELVRRGYTEEQIGKLWSRNLLRVWAENARRARR
ncbi:MAG TPA: dipeptidase [Gemmatimonadaceae bacterium]|nr:dipeptidase [Gemmatimonadaceae bacterium]